MAMPLATSADSHHHQQTRQLVPTFEIKPAKFESFGQIKEYGLHNVLTAYFRTKAWFKPTSSKRNQACRVPLHHLTPGSVVAVTQQTHQPHERFVRWILLHWLAA